MRVTTEQTEDCITNLVIEVDDDTLRPALEKAARQASSRFQIPGFRKGKAPYSVVARLLGEDYLRREALEDVALTLVERVLKEQEIKPYRPVELTDIQLNPLQLFVSVPREPQVQLGDYRSIKAERPSAEVTDENIEKALENLRRERATREPIDRPLQVGDLVTARLVFEMADGTRHDKGDVRLSVPSPEDEVIPGYSEHLVGASVGDTVEFDTTLPEDHEEEELAGQEVRVRMEIIEAEEEVLPELNDELAIMIGDYDDLDDLRQELRRRLEAAARQRAEDTVRANALKALVESATIRYPPALVEEELDRLVATAEQDMRRYTGVNLETLLKSRGSSMEEYRENQRPLAEENVRQSLALRQLVEEEGMEVTNEELTGRIERAIRETATGDPDMVAWLRSQQFRLRLQNQLLLQRAMRRLVSIATGEPEPPEEALPLEEMPGVPVDVVEILDEEEDDVFARAEEEEPHA